MHHCTSSTMVQMIACRLFVNKTLLGSTMFFNISWTVIFECKYNDLHSRFAQLHFKISCVKWPVLCLGQLFYVTNVTPRSQSNCLVSFIIADGLIPIGCWEIDEYFDRAPNYNTFIVIHISRRKQFRWRNLFLYRRQQKAQFVVMRFSVYSSESKSWLRNQRWTIRLFMFSENFHAVI